MFKYLYAYILFLISERLEFRMDGNSSRLYLSFASDVPLSDEEEDPPIFSDSHSPFVYIDPELNLVFDAETRLFCGFPLLRSALVSSKR